MAVYDVNAWAGVTVVPDPVGGRTATIGDGADSEAVVPVVSSDESSNIEPISDFSFRYFAQLALPLQTSASP
jgi:hypothetical protein